MVLIQFDSEVSSFGVPRTIHKGIAMDCPSYIQLLGTPHDGTPKISNILRNIEQVQTWRTRRMQWETQDENDQEPAENGDFRGMNILYNML